MSYIIQAPGASKNLLSKANVKTKRLGNDVLQSLFKIDDEMNQMLLDGGHNYATMPPLMPFKTSKKPSARGTQV